jgi:ABC-type transporter Mla subunit MlaD
MTTERWTEEMLDRVASTVTTAIQVNTQAIAADNERMDRLDEAILELTQLVGSNNRFLEAFSQDLRRYTENLDNISQQLAASTRCPPDAMNFDHSSR